MTTDGERVFIDTNILIRATIASAPLHEPAAARLEQLWQSGAELWISRQVIREYLMNVTRPQSYSAPVPADRAVEQIRRFQSRLKIADETSAVTEQLLTLIASVVVGGKQVHDANIVATMLVYGIDTLLTLNVEDFRRFDDQIKLMTLSEEPR